MHSPLSIDVLVGFSRLVSEGDVAPLQVLERLADGVMARAEVDGIVVVEIGVDGGLAPTVVRNLDLGPDFSVDSVDEELERAVLARCPDCQHALTLPLVSGGGLFGAVVLLWQQSRPDEGGLKLVEGMVDLAAVALDRAYRTRSLNETLEALESSREALARKETLHALGQMAAVVAHEVKNPLASLSGALQVLGQRMPSDTTESRIIEQLLTRVKDLGTMVDELLVFARPRKPIPTRIEAWFLLDNVAGLVRQNPRYPDLDLLIDVEPRSASLLGDPVQLQAVLLNLLLNAAQAMDGQGQVRLIARLEPEGFCTLTVHDSGPGVPEADRPRIFEPFFTTKIRGSGLGLAVTRQTIEAHGGRVRLEHPEGGGAAFVLEIPT